VSIVANSLSMNLNCSSFMSLVSISTSCFKWEHSLWWSDVLPPDVYVQMLNKFLGYVDGTQVVRFEWYGSVVDDKVYELLKDP